MTTVTLARLAMATRFELVLHGAHRTGLRAAGEEALNEIERLDHQLSLYRPDSEIAQVNARAAREPVRVSPALFALLRQAGHLNAETGGAFDITIAPLVRCWGFMNGNGQLPDPKELDQCRAQTGMHMVHLDAESNTVRFERDGVMLDLGAIGKGCAVDAAAEVLRQAGVTSALLHGGTSTVYALGRPPDAECWKVAIETPAPGSALPARAALRATSGANRRLPSELIIPLCDEAVSVSAVSGKFFEHEGKRFGHVLDPRSGRPARRAVLAAVVLPSSTETDALSTALLVEGAEGHDRISRLRPGMKTVLQVESAGGIRLETRHFEQEPR
jgi:thiamine biosynthesis lipoprotein